MGQELFADRSLATRLERAEGHANAAFVDSRARQFPESGAIWRDIAGTLAMFDGVGSPLTHESDLWAATAQAGWGAASQRNAERQGFQVAYTRLKWRRD